MPTYEYVCRACEHAFEEFQSMSAAPITLCPECGEGAVERLISSGGGIVFKGSGFYATDYRKDGPTKRESDSKGAAGDSKGGDSGSTDSTSKGEGKGGDSGGKGGDSGGKAKST